MKNTNKNNTPKKYVARPNSIVSQKEVDIIAPYLHEHLFPDGNFDREAIIEDAKRSKSPLHKHFNWDDTSAAHAHRLTQAQKLITCFYCVTSDGYEVPSVVSVRIVDSPNRNYMATTKAIQSPDLCEQVLQQAIQGLATWKKRYDMFIRLPEFSKLSKEIDIIVKIYNKKSK
jgi:hypothetical protein